LSLGDLVFSINCFCRTFRFAQGAIDTFVGMNNEKVRAFVKAVHGTDFYTICIFAFNAIFTNDKCHVVIS
jgi:hypothetical protein